MVRRISYWIPRTRWMHRLCKLYLDNYYGDNNADMHCNGELKFLRKALSVVSLEQREPVVFDIGANRGHWCTEVLALNPRAQVHCFEPAFATWEHLRSSGFPTTVVCNRLALGAEEGILKLNIVGPGSELNSLHFDIGHPAKSVEEVPVSTVDVYCRTHGIQRVDFLKIDVEGHDFQVLRGAAKMLEGGHVSVAQFEYGQGYIAAGVFLRDVFNYLKAFPYDTYKIHPQGLVRTVGYSTQLERFENANYVLVSKKFSAGSSFAAH